MSQAPPRTLVQALGQVTCVLPLLGIDWRPRTKWRPSTSHFLPPEWRESLSSPQRRKCTWVHRAWFAASFVVLMRDVARCGMSLVWPICVYCRTPHRSATHLETAETCCLFKWSHISVCLCVWMCPYIGFFRLALSSQGFFFFLPFHPIPLPFQTLNSPPPSLSHSLSLSLSVSNWALCLPPSPFKSRVICILPPCAGQLPSCTVQN